MAGPVQEAVEFEWKTLPDVFVPDEYSGNPTEKVEEAWAALWDCEQEDRAYHGSLLTVTDGAFTVPLEKLTLLNKSSATADYRQIETGEGAEVGALLEGAHQIHCLNLVRQYIYRHRWNYTDLPSFSGGERTQRHHVDHCMSTLLMNIQCWSDVSPVSLVSDEGGNFKRHGAARQCRKFGGIAQWVKDHAAFDTIAE